MLSVLLLTQATDPVPSDILRQALTRLTAALSPQDQLIVLACGNADAVRPELSRHALKLIELDVPELAHREAMALARSKAEHPYLLCLSGWDMVETAGFAQLRQLLKAQTPETVVLNRGAWLGAPAVTLPAPDAARLAALGTTPDLAALLDLTPDPSRVLLHANLAARLTSDAVTQPIPAEDHALWHQILTTSERPLLCPTPVWHAPQTLRDAAPTLEALSADTPDALQRGLLWADDALALAGPEHARAILRAAQAMVTRGGLSHTLSHNGPTAALLQALQDDGPALALAGLALDLALNERRKTEAFTAALVSLRSDLDLALPGPDYLHALYERIRAQ